MCSALAPVGRPSALVCGICMLYLLPPAYAQSFFFFFKGSGPPRHLPSSPPRPSPFLPPPRFPAAPITLPDGPTILLRPMNRNPFSSPTRLQVATKTLFSAALAIATCSADVSAPSG